MPIPIWRSEGSRDVVSQGFRSGAKDIDMPPTGPGSWVEELADGGGLRTRETLACLPVFETGPLNHSATHPVGGGGASVHACRF